MTVDRVASTREDIVLFAEDGYGRIVVPGVPHKDRECGGHLMVDPAGRFNHVSDMLAQPDVWCRYHLLCAIAERAMLEVLPSLNGGLTDGRIGIINLLEAGNWGVHFHREKGGAFGLKGAESKTVHAHLYGRSILEPSSTAKGRMLHWGWGEAPRFPDFVDTPFGPKNPDKDWIVPEQFNDEECRKLTKAIIELFSRYRGLCP
jgi:hypothetical protein